MRRLLLLVLIASVSLPVFGCSSQTSEQNAAQSPPAQGSSAQSPPAQIKDTRADESSGLAAQAVSVSLSGHLGCGHCDHHIGESCAAALQVADGTVYILDGVDEESDLFTKRLEHGEVTVAGAPSEIDGVHHLKVDSYQM